MATGGGGIGGASARNHAAQPLGEGGCGVNLAVWRITV